MTTPVVLDVPDTGVQWSGLDEKERRRDGATESKSGSLCGKEGPDQRHVRRRTRNIQEGEGCGEPTKK